MRGVLGVSKGGAAGRTRGSGAAGRPEGGFSLGGAGPLGAASTEGGGAAAPAAAVGFSLLAAQESGGRGGEGRDAAARRRAASILDELDGLQAELLGGRTDRDRLARLAALAEGEEGTDSGLRDVVRAASLRARIELARRMVGPNAHRTATVR